MRMVPAITLDSARATLRAAIDHASEAGLQMSVAVVDAGGNLMAFERMEDANLCSGEISRNKAYGALSFKARTEDLGEHAEPGGACYGMETSIDSPLAFWSGGVPLEVDGIVVGAIGAGGGTPAEDAATADAGVGEFRRIVS